LFNGDQVYYNYIKLFNGSLQSNELNNSNNVLTMVQANYSTIFTLSADSPVLDLLDAESLSKGIIKLKSIPTTDIELKLNVSYNGLVVPKEMNVIIRGISMNYSESGEVATNPQTLNKNLTISVTSGSDLTLSNYLDFHLTTEGGSESVVDGIIADSGSAVNAASSTLTARTLYTTSSGGTISINAQPTIANY